MSGNPTRARENVTWTHQVAEARRVIGVDESGDFIDVDGNTSLVLEELRAITGVLCLVLVELRVANLHLADLSDNQYDDRHVDGCD